MMTHMSGIECRKSWNVRNSTRLNIAKTCWIKTPTVLSLSSRHIDWYWMSSIHTWLLFLITSSFQLNWLRRVKNIWWERVIFLIIGSKRCVECNQTIHICGRLYWFFEHHTNSLSLFENVEIRLNETFFICRSISVLLHESGRYAQIITREHEMMRQTILLFFFCQSRVHVALETRSATNTEKIALIWAICRNRNLQRQTHPWQYQNKRFFLVMHIFRVYRNKLFESKIHSLLILAHTKSTRNKLNNN